MAELITGKPLFASKGELDCIQKIFGMVGAPTKQNWPGVEKLDNWQKVGAANMRVSSAISSPPSRTEVWEN